MCDWISGLLRKWFTRAPTHVEIVLVSVGSNGIPVVVSRLKVAPVEIVDDHVAVVVRLHSILEQLTKE